MSQEKNSSSKNRLKIFALCSFFSVLALAIGGFGGYMVSRSMNSLSPEEVKLIEEYRYLINEWVFSDRTDGLSDAALEGMADAIASSQGDNFTFYTPTTEEQNLENEYYGFGFTSHAYDGGLYLVEVHEGPAKEAGLRVGDVLYGVQRGSDSYYDFPSHSVADIEAYLNDENHEKDVFRFTYARSGVQSQVSLIQGEYSKSLVGVIQEPSLANDYTLALKIPTFLKGTAVAVEKVLQKYVEADKKPLRLVMDFRGNGGGYLDECSKLAKLFVKKGSLIYELHGKEDRILERSFQDSNPEFTFDSYDILMDGNTASASETFALAMRAGANCTLHGFTSYGKGIAQKVQYFSDNSALRFTFAYVYCPEKESETIPEEAADEDKILCIQGKGIQPDVPFAKDYQWLSLVPSITNSLAIDETSQLYVLRLLQWLNIDGIPERYNDSYHFVDAIEDFMDYAKIKDSDENLCAFDEDGTVSLSLFNKMTKVGYDLYNNWSNVLLEEALND